MHGNDSQKTMQKYILLFIKILQLKLLLGFKHTQTGTQFDIPRNKKNSWNSYQRIPNFEEAVFYAYSENKESYSKKLLVFK